MSISSSIPVIIERVKVATPRSQIAIFKSMDVLGNFAFDAFFANTILGAEIIDMGGIDLMGVYDRTDNLEDLSDKLKLIKQKESARSAALVF